jgi:membrane fusion protein, adhesin transport system
VFTTEDRTRSDRPAPWAAFASVLLLAALLATFLAWAAQAELEEVTRGQGRVIPASSEQLIQSLETGVLSALLVREGDVVERDQVLLRIDDTRARAFVRELEAKAAALDAQAVRLRAEAYAMPLAFAATARSSDFVQRETQAFNARRHALQQGLQGLERGVALLDREIAITRPMVQRGLVSEVELLRLERQRNDLAMQLSERGNRFRAEAASDLSRVESDLVQVRESLIARTDAAQRTEIRSPMRGTVKSIRATTIGSVIQPGQDIMQIVPADDTLLVEAFVRPADVAFLHPGQSATVKLSAYDFATYGGLAGFVEFISPDTLRDDRNGLIAAAEDVGAYYRVVVRTRDTALVRADGTTLPIIPGMTATVEMLAGRKTVLQYLLKPLNRASQSMRER